ncbi:unnamed protein product [Caenorhabditis angaria]|uniref:Uncharacterized protein n=1 Tax=Caenorhabditis angaria TaxID=860376 RepID=A0A9P1IIW1_9PELO|nr:unnamed protein product [Caenorhabditis angaria]
MAEKSGIVQKKKSGKCAKRRLKLSRKKRVKMEFSESKAWAQPFEAQFSSIEQRLRDSTYKILMGTKYYACAEENIKKELRSQICQHLLNWKLENRPILPENYDERLRELLNLYQKVSYKKSLTTKNVLKRLMRMSRKFWKTMEFRGLRPEGNLDEFERNFEFCRNQLENQAEIYEIQMREKDQRNLDFVYQGRPNSPENPEISSQNAYFQQNLYDPQMYSTPNTCQFFPSSTSQPTQKFASFPEFF